MQFLMLPLTSHNDEVSFKMKSETLETAVRSSFFFVELLVSNLIHWVDIYELFYMYRYGFGRDYVYHNYVESFRIQFGMSKNRQVGCCEHACRRI